MSVTYLFVSNGNDSICDGKEGEYDDEPERPHPNCACKIDVKRRDRDCMILELEPPEVNEEVEVEGDEEEPPTYPNDDPDDPNNPKLEIDEAPPEHDPHPPRAWNQVDLECTFPYRIECGNGYVKTGEITVSLETGTRLDSMEAYESIIVPFLLEGAEKEAWAQLEEIADEVEAGEECGCPEMSA